MVRFVRQFSNKATLTRAVTLAAAGSGISCLSSSSDQISVSLPWLWRSLEGSGLSPSFMPLNHLCGFFPASFPRPNVPDPNMSEGAALDSSDSSKQYSNCLDRDSIANAAAKIGPAVVNLRVTRGFNGVSTGRTLGSGTIINEDGTILTCAHVLVCFPILKIEVTLQDGRSFEGRLVNTDVHGDIAIVKIESETPLPYAKLGSSRKLRPGDWVVAMGCPFALQNSVTAGVISCVNRKASDLGIGGLYTEYLQTDCPVNQGNSGGPLVNVDGEVIGVNIMKMVGADGMNFAVPVDSAAKIISHFERNGRVVRPWLGLRMIDLNDALIAHLKDANAYFPDVKSGVLIPMVSPASPAREAGFLPGDVLVEFGGKPVATTKEVIEIMSDRVGEAFKAVVKRANGVTCILTVIPIEAYPDM